MRRVGLHLLHAASRGMTCAKRKVSMADATRASVLLCRAVCGSRSRTCTFRRTSCGASTMIDRTCEASALARIIGRREPVWIKVKPSAMLTPAWVRMRCARITAITRASKSSPIHTSSPCASYSSISRASRFARRASRRASKSPHSLRSRKLRTALAWHAGEVRKRTRGARLCVARARAWSRCRS